MSLVPGAAAAVVAISIASGSSALERRELIGNWCMRLWRARCSRSTLVNVSTDLSLSADDCIVSWARQP